MRHCRLSGVIRLNILKSFDWVSQSTKQEYRGARLNWSSIIWMSHRLHNQTPIQANGSVPNGFLHCMGCHITPCEASECSGLSWTTLFFEYPPTSSYAWTVKRSALKYNSSSTLRQCRSSRHCSHDRPSVISISMQLNAGKCTLLNTKSNSTPLEKNIGNNDASEKFGVDHERKLAKGSPM